MVFTPMVVWFSYVTVSVQSILGQGRRKLDLAASKKVIYQVAYISGR